MICFSYIAVFLISILTELGNVRCESCECRTSTIPHLLTTMSSTVRLLCLGHCDDRLFDNTRLLSIVCSTNDHHYRMLALFSAAHIKWYFYVICCCCCGNHLALWFVFQSYVPLSLVVIVVLFHCDYHPILNWIYRASFLCLWLLFCWINPVVVSLAQQHWLRISPKHLFYPNHSFYKFRCFLLF